MRSPWIAALVLAASPPARADEVPPLWEAELRLGYGVALGGSGDMTSSRTSPLTITALGAVAIDADPPLSAFGGLVVETLDRNSVGGTAGVRLGLGPLRLAGGGTVLIAPDTLWGATASTGACRRVAKRLAACGDVVLTSFFAGGDLAPGHTVTQVQAVLGMVFDAP